MDPCPTIVSLFNPSPLLTHSSKVQLSVSLWTPLFHWSLSQNSTVAHRSMVFVTENICIGRLTLQISFQSLSPCDLKATLNPPVHLLFLSVVWNSPSLFSSCVQFLTSHSVTSQSSCHVHSIILCLVLVRIQQSKSVTWVTPPFPERWHFLMGKPWNWQALCF